MADTPSITIISEMTYRGKPERTSNKYHFTGTTPTTDAGWKTLADAIITATRPCVTNVVSFVGAYGYEAGNELSVSQIDYTVPPNTVLYGTLDLGSNGSIARMNPESCAVVRWRTPERNSRKKWIYLRKYIHGSATTQNGDNLAPTALAALNAYASKMIDGTLPGGAKYCGPQGAEAGAILVNPYAGTRELKRRGKRPSR